ncbi:MAG: hypothetical protein WAO98_10750 [Alphaproteobacteria bacterium]
MSANVLSRGVVVGLSSLTLATPFDVAFAQSASDAQSLISRAPAQCKVYVDAAKKVCATPPARKTPPRRATPRRVASPPPTASPPPQQPVVVQVQMPPAPVPAPQLSPAEQAGLRPVKYRTGQLVPLPIGTLGDVAFSEADMKWADKGGCRARWNTPINGHGVNHTVSVSSTMVGVVGLDPTENVQVFVPNGTALISASKEMSSATCQGWLLPVTAVIGTVGGLVIANEGVQVAKQSLKATQNLYADIGEGIRDGSITNIFGTLGGCGNTAVGNSTTQNISSNCVIGSAVVNSGVGGGNLVSPTNPSTVITPFSASIRYGFGN